MNAGRAALLPQLPRLAQAAQQLSAWGAAAAARLRGAAAELQRLADQNAAFAAELAAQPGCAALARRGPGRGRGLPVRGSRSSAGRITVLQAVSATVFT